MTYQELVDTLNKVRAQRDKALCQIERLQLDTKHMDYLSLKNLRYTARIARRKAEAKQQNKKSLGFMKSHCYCGKRNDDKIPLPLEYEKCCFGLTRQNILAFGPDNQEGPPTTEQMLNRLEEELRFNGITESQLKQAHAVVLVGGKNNTAHKHLWSKAIWLLFQAAQSSTSTTSVTDIALWALADLGILLTIQEATTLERLAKKRKESLKKNRPEQSIFTVSKLAQIIDHQDRRISRHGARMGRK